jgi:hypothetical protein
MLVCGIRAGTVHCVLTLSLIDTDIWLVQRHQRGRLESAHKVLCHHSAILVHGWTLPAVVSAASATQAVTPVGPPQSNDSGMLLKDLRIGM